MFLKIKNSLADLPNFSIIIKIYDIFYDAKTIFFINAQTISAMLGTSMGTVALSHEKKTNRFKGLNQALE